MAHLTSAPGVLGPTPECMLLEVLAQKSPTQRRGTLSSERPSLDKASRRWASSPYNSSLPEGSIGSRSSMAGSSAEANGDISQYLYSWMVNHAVQPS